MTRAAPTPTLLTELRSEHPEWKAYLALVGLALEEAQSPEWGDAVPPLPEAASGQPLLAGLSIRISERLLKRWVRQILSRAAEESTTVGPLAEAVQTGRLDAVRVFEAALAGVAEPPGALGLGDHAGASALRSLAPLIGMPLWQACGGAWADRLPAAWGGKACPVCGAWPALGEIRGLENSRRLRCGQCGTDWHGEWLRCPFCDTGDHTQLGALVLPDRCDTRRVDTCHACRGYLKTITTLGPTPRGEVMLRDLATAVLDVAAIEHGYRRPLPVRQASPRILPVPSRLSSLLRGRA